LSGSETVNRGHGLARFGLRQSFATFLSMSKKTVVEFSRYPVAFVAMFVQIFLIIMMFMFAAFSFTPGDGPSPETQHFAGVAIYGLILNLFLTFILWEIGFSIREEQFRGTLESLYLSPANKFSNLVSRIFAITLFTAAMAILAIFVAGAMVGGLPFENVALAMVILLFSMLGFLGLGFIFAGVTLKLKETAQLLVNFMQFFFMIFCAMFFPFSALRQARAGFVVDYVSRWIPVSYCVDAFRSALLNFPQEPYPMPELLPLWQEMVIIIAFGLVTPIVGYFVYKRAERTARLKGTLAEY